jgi:excisionase family DNA binding protein
MKILDYFYTESQAAKQLSLNRITIWRWIKAGKLNIQRLGGVVFIPKEEIDSLMNRVNQREFRNKL